MLIVAVGIAVWCLLFLAVGWIYDRVFPDTDDTAIWSDEVPDWDWPTRENKAPARTAIRPTRDQGGNP